MGRRKRTADSQGALVGACPHCASGRAPLAWSVDPDTGVRTYRCADCGRTWSVDGVQATLDLGREAEPLLTLTLTVVRAQ